MRTHPVWENANIELTTSNVQRRSGKLPLSFDVRCWTFDVGRFSPPDCSGRRSGGRLTCLVRLACLAVFAMGAVHADEEDDLIAVLRSGADASAKWAACQKLRQTGTARSVPALAGLLGKERLSHAARHALEAMSLPQAGAALRAALAKADGSIRLGLLDSLGWRRDAQAVPLIAVLFADTDEETATAGATALGRIGGGEAASALIAVRDRASGKVQLAVCEALLRCADSFLAAGDAAKTVELCSPLLEGRFPPQIRAGAWRGLVLADAGGRPRRVANALVGKDEAIRIAALAVVRSLDDPRTLAECASRWNSLPPESQLALLDVHAARGREGLGVVLAGSRSSDVAVRTAAWRALGLLNEVAAVPVLAKAAAQGAPAESDAARESLLRLRGPGVKEALVAVLPGADASVAVEVLRAIGGRGEPGSVAVLLVHARGAHELVRLAALQALGSQPPREALASLLGLWSDMASDSEGKAWQKALLKVCAADPDRCAAAIVEAFNGGDTAQKRVLLPALRRVGTTRALEVVRVTAKNQGGELSTEAIRSLSQWGTLEAAPVLLELATTSADTTRNALALRGYVEVAKLEADPARLLRLLRQAMEGARRVTEKRLVLGAMGGIMTPDALAAALPYLDDAELVDEAAAAAVKMARELASAHPDLARQAADRVLARCRNEGIRNRALTLRAKPRSGPFIRNWLACGPYSQRGVFGAEAVFEIPLGPEKPGEEVRWRAVPPTDMVNLMAFFPGKENCAAYLRTRIISPRECEALLLMASDDGIKAWLNGAVVHSNNIDRPAEVDQDVAVARLREGRNDLMLKITQGRGGWMACARLVQTDGAPFTDLRYEAGGGTEPVLAPPASPPKPPPPKPAVPADMPPRGAFARTQLSDQFYAEGAYYGDLNRDGALDVVAGPFWFAGPGFEARHEYRPARTFDPKGYSDNFLTYVGDFSGDEWPDILCVPFPGKEGYWYENPRGETTPWRRHLACPMVGNESPVWEDVTGDGRPELVFCIDGYLGFAGPDPARPGEAWVFTPVSSQDKRYQRFTHGVGCGDINGDGRVDVVEGVGWWEQPSVPKPTEPWPFHPQRFAQAAAQMLVGDVDGDGLADVVTAWHCHRYGLLWYRQVRATGGDIGWRQQVILPPAPDVATPDLRPSQLHALEFVDMNGDGVRDILTGKRFWAHGPKGDVEPDAPAVVLWFEVKRRAGGQVGFVPHLVDDDSGVGTQVAAADLDGDARPDVIVANKKGIFLHLSAKRSKSGGAAE